MTDVIPTPSTFSGKGVAVALGAAALVLGGVWVSNHREPADGTASAISACRNDVRSQLKSPSTAKFSGESSNVTSGDKRNGTLAVSGYVDSQNTFGGTVRTAWTCTANVVEATASRADAVLA